ncbi:MAG: hypothetical protein ACK53L_01530, partial [Pirellulaceae bacterium]
PRAVNNEVAKSIAEAESERNTADAQAAIDRSNESTRAFQRQIATVLRSITKQRLSDDPKAWWAWWERYEESYAVGPKNLQSSYSEDRSGLVYDAERVYAIGLRPTCECLVSGTRIQTDRGLQSVETLHVGDQVVSQDIASGELCL